MKLKRILATTVSLVMITGILPATAFAGNARAADAVSYVDRSWDGSQVVSKTKEVTEYISFSELQPENGAYELTDGCWYVVEQNCNLSAKVNCSGTVNLILCDGTQLTSHFVGGIHVPKNATLNIYGQSNDTGILNCTCFRSTEKSACIGGAEGEDFGTLNIFGGDISATGSDYAPGIGSGKDADMSGIVRVFGGNVKSTGGRYGGPGIGSGCNGDMKGALYVYGGDIQAASRDAAGVGAASFDVPNKGNMSGSVTVYSGFLEARCESTYGGTGNIGSSIGTSISPDNSISGGEFDGTVSVFGGSVALRKSIAEEIFDSTTYAPAVGSLNNMTDGTLEIADNMCVKKLGIDPVLYKDRLTECRSTSETEWILIEKCDHTICSYTPLSAEKHTRTCNCCHYEIEELHSFDLDDNCVCGYSSQESGTHLKGYSLSLAEDISLNFYVDFSENDITNGDPYVEFTIPSESSSVTKKVYVKSKTGEERELARVDTGNTYIFKCPVAAKEMTSEISAQVIYDDTEGKQYKYSVKKYADHILKNEEGDPEYTKAEALVKAMLNYGAYSQTYFGRNTTMLANYGLKPYEISLGQVQINHDGYSVTSLPDGVTLAGTSIYLKSGTTLSLYFKNTSGNDVSFKLDGKPILPKENNGFLQIDITDIKAVELMNDFTISVGESGTVKYSVMNYCQSVAQTGTENLRNVVKALYKYAQAAKDYSANNA